MKERIAVLMGGPSAEFDVSINTGAQMLRHLAGATPLLRAVVIDAERKFHAQDITGEIPPVADLARPSRWNGFAGPFAASDAAAVWKDIDCAVLGLHGEFGEDGLVQGYLEAIGMPYTGTGVFGSSVGMDKVATKFILQQLGIDTPPYSLYGKHFPETTAKTIAARHGFPCFVKCPQSGSSKLMGRATSEAELTVLLDELSRESEVVLIETAISGVELSCPVLEQADGTSRALLPVEIRPVASSYFDYTAKYTDGACEEIVPAPQPAGVLARVQDVCVRVHEALRCAGVTRTDVIVSNDRLYVLEINTLPGFTTTSLVPKSYAAAGGTYLHLLEQLVGGAMRRAASRS